MKSKSPTRAFVERAETQDAVHAFTTGFSSPQTHDVSGLGSTDRGEGSVPAHADSNPG